jgi:uncharacterized protein (TIGR02246 family)
MNHEQQIRNLLERLVEAWNTRDLEVLARLFVADAEYITADGERMNGSDRIANLLHDAPAGARATLENISIRAAGEAASVMCRFVVSDGDSRLAIVSTAVVVKQGTEWLIDRSQNTAEKGSTVRSEPVLPSRNLNDTRAFYRKLGFVPWFDGKIWPGYEIMSNGNLVVHFFDASEIQPPPKDAGCYWRVQDADGFHAKCAAVGLAAEGVPRLGPLCTQPWGMREFILVDPSGNLIRVGHDLN